MVGFSETEITVSEDIGTVDVGLQVFQQPLVSAEFINSNMGFLSTVFTVEGTALGMNHTSYMFTCLFIWSFNIPAMDDFTAISSAAISISVNLLSASFELMPPMITVTITNDNIPEELEEFSLSLTQLFQDRVIGQPNVSRLIIEDDDGKMHESVPFNTVIHSHHICLCSVTPSQIGLEQNLYDVMEGDGLVEICVAILSPGNLSLLREPYQANLTLFLQSVTAQGSYV